MNGEIEVILEDVALAIALGRQVRAHGPYDVLIGDEHLTFKHAVIADPVPTGRQILEAAGVEELSEYLVLQALVSGSLEELGLSQTVDLRAAGVEKFLVFRTDRTFRFQIDKRDLEWGATFVSGLTLKKLAGVDTSTHGVWIEVSNGSDRQIDDTELVDLSMPGVERFYTRILSIVVRVNTRPHEVHSTTLSFMNVVALAFPDAAASETRIYTVTFKRGPLANPEGTLVEGRSVQIKNGMLFNVTFTDKS